ncbi:IS3 family transposase, partial [Kribbella deserti]
PSSYSPELRERAVRMVVESKADYGSEFEAIKSVAEKLGIGSPETLRKWVRRAEIDAGQRPGVTTEESDQLKALKREVAELRRANEILKSAANFLRGGARPPTEVIVAFINDHKDRFGVEPICRVLSGHGCKIAPSTYYDNRNRQPSKKKLRDAALIEVIEKVRAEVRFVQLFGAGKLWLHLRGLGHDVARCTVERLMTQMGISGAVRGKKPRTTIPDEKANRPADRVDRRFVASAPNRLWVADFTYVTTRAGTVYVAFIIDVFSRRIIGWKAATTMTTPLVLDALDMAVWTRRSEGVTDLTGLVHHNDAGSQYTSITFTQALTDAGIDASVGSVGDAYDNALAETHMGLFKSELIHPYGPWKGLHDVETATLDWTHWFNTARPHESIQDLTPLQAEHTHYTHQ